MLDRFYKLQDWDKRTSWKTRKCMTELGLEDVAKKLEEAGKLIDETKVLPLAIWLPVL